MIDVLFEINGWPVKLWVIQGFLNVLPVPQTTRTSALCGSHSALPCARSGGMCGLPTVVLTP